MAIIQPEFEYVDRATETIRYLEHGWPTDLCRWHAHEEYELHLIAATRGKDFVGDYIGDFRPGALYLTGPNLPHNWITDEVKATEPVDIRDMLVQFNKENINQLSAAFPEFQVMNNMWELAKSGIEFVGFDADIARALFQDIRNAKGAERIAAFIRLLVQVNDHPKKKTLSVVSVTQATESSRQARIAEVVDHITSQFSEEISLEQAARMANMSPTTFSRNFHKATGNKFVEFVNRVRIGHACSKLHATDEQVSSICYDVGFQNLANFNRQFLKMKDMTPTAYRELARSELIRKDEVVQ